MQALHNAAHDGDTITLPAGTFTWTSRLNITKGITLQGATTIADAGTGNPTITDGTIIKDDTPRRGAGVFRHNQGRDAFEPIVPVDWIHLRGREQHTNGPHQRGNSVVKP